MNLQEDGWAHTEGWKGGVKDILQWHGGSHRLVEDNAERLVDYTNRVPVART
jgi:hypothetical protein